MSRYVEAMRELACEILDLIGEGLWANSNSSILSGLLRDIQHDSLIRLNNYPPAAADKLGFGAHTDPQMLTILRSNGLPGLQISLHSHSHSHSGVWVPVDPHPPSAFCVNVGDVLQAMTNGRFVSVKHRAVVNSTNSRMSIVYFAAPPLHATINCIHTSNASAMYRSFSWADYKKFVYAGRLADSRLNYFKLQPSKHC